MLQSIQEPFESFDILTDEEVRQGIKKLKQWPTFPQLYVRGELIGGCDILTELAANDELKQTIQEIKQEGKGIS